jgi:hypothetical protein
MIGRGCDASKTTPIEGRNKNRAFFGSLADRGLRPRARRRQGAVRQLPDHGIFVSVTPGHRAAAWSITVGLGGATLVWWITPHGAGLSPDSVYYIAAARWVLAGDGVRSLDGGGPLTVFAPLYPAVLAGAASVSPIHSTRRGGLMRPSSRYCSPWQASLRRASAGAPRRGLPRRSYCSFPKTY